MTEVWEKWEGRAVNGIFPLRRRLSASDDSAVFLTEHKAQNLADAALKLVPAIPDSAQAQLSYWTAAAALSHPHLIRLLDSGRCELEGRPFLFVVMEYAEQTLSQLLPNRALTPDEVRELLPPTLEALSFLHGKNLIAGGLKPSNFLVVGDQLRLASDTVRPAGKPAATIARHSAYTPPEARDGSFFAAGDIWALGVTLVEALTQQLPTWPDDHSESVALPAGLPPAFALIIRRCLARNPAKRPTVADLQAWIDPAPRLPAASVADLPASAPDQAPRQTATQRFVIPAIAGLFVVAVAVWAGLHALSSPKPQQQAAPAAAAPQAPQTAVPSATPLIPTPSPVLHEEIPDVPPRVRNSIRGHLKVAVRVTVDASGNVIDATLDRRGPSKYFARLATQAAGKWKFAPAGDKQFRQWVLRFEFTRGGVTGEAESPRY
jgi:TonB family protein